MPKYPALLLTSKSHLLEFVKAARTHSPFRNSNKSFVGVKPTPLTVHTFNRMIVDDTESHLAFLLDDPDYIIMSNGVPIAWHSTTRGTASKAKPPNPERHTWVIRRYNTALPVRVSHYNTTVDIVNILNREADND